MGVPRGAPEQRSKMVTGTILDPPAWTILDPRGIRGSAPSIVFEEILNEYPPVHFPCRMRGPEFL